MPLLAVAATAMDNDRIFHQDGSPGSGSGQSHQELIVSSLARRKKHGGHPPPIPSVMDRPLPMQPGVDGRGSQLHHPQPVYGVSNQGYARHDQSVHGPRLNTTCETTVSIPEDSDEAQEVIEVQILPQDENWGETTTGMTTASDLDYAMEDLSKWQIKPKNNFSYKCAKHLGPLTSAVLATLAFVSPILMVLLPKLGVFNIRHLECDVTCDGMLISFSFKLLILLLGTWGVFFRRPRATLPRIFVFRAMVSLLILVFVVSFWLFYGVHLLEDRNKIEYKDIVQFALSLIDALLFVHYLALILLELRHLRVQYYVKVVRSPDGQSQSYTIGDLSIQRAAAHVLERYYVDFPIYNPYLDVIPGTRSKKGYKVYDVDGPANGNINDGNSTVVSTVSKRGHNERFYEEGEYERKVRKRRARLITATEDSFTHIRRMRGDGQVVRKQALSPYEAAQAVFPSLSRPLQKYLRITRQQPRHTIQSILDHLATSLNYDMSPRSFLEKYLVSSPVLQNDREQSSVQSWALICDSLLSRSVVSGSLFQLRQGDVSLLCSVHALPHLHIEEEIIDPKSNKFVLRMSSETSV